MLIPTTHREEMDSGAMIRRAYELGEQLDTYDPAQLIVDVRGLLEAHGLHPELPPGTGRMGMAAGAAGMLLRAFGILPAAPITTIDRSNAPDPDER
jgi:hypothetical protein